MFFLMISNTILSIFIIKECGAVDETVSLLIKDTKSLVRNAIPRVILYAAVNLN